MWQSPETGWTKEDWRILSTVRKSGTRFQMWSWRGQTEHWQDEKKKKSARPKGIQGAGSLLPAKGWCLKYLAAAKQAPEPEKWVHSARVLEALC